MSGKLTLKEARENMKLSQEAIAEKIGVKPATISKWEKGEAICLNSFDKHVIAEICEILKINNFELKWTLE